MAKLPQSSPTQEAVSTPRIIADFGGRRRILDRRVAVLNSGKKERRVGKERRSGFDRRSVVNRRTEDEPDMENTSDGNPAAKPSA